MPRPRALSPRAERAALVLLAALLGGAAVFASLRFAGGGDYAREPAGVVAGDDAAPALQALMHGDLAGFARVQPAIGLTSLLLRLPFAALSRALGGGLMAEYRAGALACLAVAAALSLYVAVRMRRGGSSWLLVVAAALLPIANPVTFAGIRTGHPEDLLCGVLCAGAVLAAERRRALPAAVLLGLACGAKPWGVLAAFPVALALPAASRARAAVIAGAVALVLVAPGPLMNRTAFSDAARTISLVSNVTPQSAWFPLAHSQLVRSAPGTYDRYRWLPGRLDRRTISIALVMAAALGALFLARRPRRRGDALRLLAVLMMARGVLDPVALDYYGIPLLVALAALAVETPLTAVALLVLASVGLHLAQVIPGAGAQFAVTVGWILPVGGVLARGLADRRGAAGPLASPARARRAHIPA